MALAPSPLEPPPLLLSPDVDGLARAPTPVVKAILVALCEDPGVRAQALRQLDRLLRFEAEVRKQEALRTTTTPPPPPPPGSISNVAAGRRLKPTPAEPKICVQCDGIFTEDKNIYGACWYHSGELELYDETLIDRMPGEMSLYDLDTESTRARHPEAFRWCCCFKKGNQPGCVGGRHESNPDWSRKGRGDSFSDLEDDPLRLDEDDDDDDDDEQAASYRHASGSSHDDAASPGGRRT
ncbi:hypothetical protein Cob_v010925 [Colletotrichum orbiculare MAFF 240422]|uniref:Uncharacterized protein n=1 Tax=Colletotrichum orbiculare (strain 104-T / ATCC 96160 / CBS 514.97 / LARS 414 / MAFF 240422) TaxID=1213857 RepID=A0A484FF35_COLOR|nr:hypothetical protein Cob_v010925 [Colletotrichum orbiculare MAFF 240422]